MKLITLILISLPLISFAQQPQLDSLSHWETKLVILHPEGYTDTVWIGFNVDGGAGLQSNLDVIDTILDLPVSIASNDPQVHDELGLGYELCVNLKRDIREFKEGITSFYLYVRSDSFFMGDDAWIDTIMRLEVKMFPLKFQFANDDYFIKQAYIYNMNSDFGVMDYNQEGIYSTLGTSLEFQKLSLWPPINPIFSCQNQSDVLLLRVDITVEKITGIKSNITDSPILIYPNPSSGIVYVNTRVYPLRMEVFNQLGKTVHISILNQETGQIDLTHLPHGVYFLRFTENNNTFYNQILLINN